MGTVSGSTLNEAMRLQKNSWLINLSITKPHKTTQDWTAWKLALSLLICSRSRTHLTLFGSLSNNMKIVQALSPHGSLSDMRIISAAMRCVRSLGSSTSVQARWRLLASRSTSCSRCESSCTALALTSSRLSMAPKRAPAVDCNGDAGSVAGGVATCSTLDM